MPRGREIGTVAAELLEFLSASAEQKMPAASERWDETSTIPVMKAANVPGLTTSTLPAVWGAELPERTEFLRQDLGQIPERKEIPMPAEIGAEARAEAAAWSTLRVQKAPEMQQSMDDISEFFRRDSRRYDNGFSGGSGL